LLSYSRSSSNPEFHLESNKSISFYFGTRPLEIFTHPTKIQVKDPPFHLSPLRIQTIGVSPPPFYYPKENQRCLLVPARAHTFLLRGFQAHKK
jgi:hypothetical protein